MSKIRGWETDYLDIDGSHELILQMTKGKRTLRCDVAR